MIGAVHIVLIVDHAALAHWRVVPGLVRAEIVTLDHCVASWVVLIVIYIITINISKLNVIVDGGGGVWTAGRVLVRIVLEVVAVMGVMAVKALGGLQAVDLGGDAVYAFGPRQ